MSAIAGIYYRDGRPADPAELGCMLERLPHRGRDGSGIWHHGSVGLVQRLLWTTPESRREQLPLVGEAGRLVLAADARLDNRGELISTLALRDRPPGEITDGELILCAYQRWGEECPARLIGDFAFVIWDALRQTLVCARDPIGVKGLYYYSAERVFAFATEIKALLCPPDIPRRLNEVRVADLLVRRFDDRSSTFYQEIFRLPAAHVMAVGRSETRTRAYWQLDPARSIQLRSDEEYAERFRAIFGEAVRSRLRSAAGVGSALSGGLDSSSIACTAKALLAEQNGLPLPTYSAIFPGLPPDDLRAIDERSYSEAVLAQGGFEPHYVRGDTLSPLQDIATVLWHTDEAFIAPNLYIPWALYGAAQQQVRVFLDGVDGDTTVSHGLGLFTELLVSGRWRRLVQEAVTLTRTSNPASYAPWQILWIHAARPLLPDGAVRLGRALRGRTPPDVVADALVNPDFARRIGLAERVDALAQAERRPALTEREAHRRGLSSGLIPYTLELADKAAAAFGLEARYPFFDRRLIEFCLALPAEQKLHAGWTRAVLRRAMTGTLPPKVQWRNHKANLSPNFTRRLLECERGTLDRIILGERRLLAAYVDIPALQTAYRRYLSPATRTSRDAATLYGVAVLALWLERTGLTA